MAWFKNLKELLGFDKAPHCLCMVVSEQEGAEIWVEGKKTNYRTPKAIAIPKKKDVNITIKMVGHHDHHATVRSEHTLSYYYCNLDRVPLRLIKNEIHRSASL
ncbi:hypothetical protein [Bdellovibrio bacteriovorus]|uniref:PEGA domain-containing protein n=1 Tax=Bdellovibrio bacteriovorus TaxID=959 RepID=A0A162GCE8_BDEBC|nr:hypothetical protein [Bdellovibrio bacteriovorus]KYG67799.1 hypothetical protein AZI87_00515 [Bdellovibrio bacteriovorus]